MDSRYLGLDSHIDREWERYCDMMDGDEPDEEHEDEEELDDDERAAFDAFWSVEADKERGMESFGEQARANGWNRAYPVGTMVRRVGLYTYHRTTSAAYVQDGRAVVELERFPTMAFPLDDVEAVRQS
jgi:hypothetical protein